MLSSDLLERLRDPLNPAPIGMGSVASEGFDIARELAAMRREQQLRAITAFAWGAKVHCLEAGADRPARSRSSKGRPKPLRRVTLSAMDATGSNHYLLGAA